MINSPEAATSPFGDGCFGDELGQEVLSKFQALGRRISDLSGKPDDSFDTIERLNLETRCGNTLT